MTYTCRNASLSTLAEHLGSDAGLEDQAGSRVEGKWGPLWSTAGNPGCRMHPGRGSGVVFSWVISLTIQREVTRPPGRNAVALEATSDQRPRRSRRSRALPARTSAATDQGPDTPTPLELFPRVCPPPARTAHLISLPFVANSPAASARGPMTFGLFSMNSTT